MSFQTRLSCRFPFESAHFQPSAPEGHPNRRIHGHSYVLEVTMVGPVNPTNGCLIEHGELSKLVKPVLEKLDHNLLNDIPGLEFPMSETIAKWAWAQLSATVPHLFEITIDRPQSGIRASYQGERK